MNQTNSPAKDSLLGKVAVVTGAARGIGLGTAVAFAREGANFVGIDICAPVYPPSGVTPADRDDLDETGRRVQAAGVRWLNLIVDQRDMPALRVAGARVEQQFGSIDIVFRERRYPGVQTAS